MRRKTFDVLMSTAGLLLAVVLLVAGVVLTWASTFVHDQVTTQLTAQKIFFPEKGSESLANPKVEPFLTKYAGQQLTNGAQAKAYADHYIKVHVDEATGGRTYSEVSTASRANPDDQELAALVQVAFRGETLRGLLLNAYAFDTMGQVAGYAAYGAYAAAALMLLLALLGFWHGRVVPVESELGIPRQTGVRPSADKPATV